MAGTGALVATSQLPSFAEDKPEAFPERGDWERLAVSYATVNIGLEKPFSVMHLSDTHLTAAYPHEGEDKLTVSQVRTKTFGGRQEEALRDSLDWAKKNTDYVIHTGDLIDFQSEANFDLVRKYFGENMTGSMGNHEFSINMWLGKQGRDEAYKDLTRDKVQAVYPYDIRFCAQVVDGVNFITLDNVYGYVVPEQVERFREEVKKGLPIVLCMHVPFFTDNIWRATVRFWNAANRKFTVPDVPKPTGDYRIQQEDATTRDFIAYLKTEPLLKAILAGHEHITLEDRFSPTAMEYLIGGNFLFQVREILFV